MSDCKPSICDIGEHLFQPTGIEHKIWTSNNTDSSDTAPESVPVQEEWKCYLCGETILVFEGDSP